MSHLRERWNICRCIWFLQIVALLAIEVWGFRWFGITIQSAVVLVNVVIGVAVGMWAVRRTPQFILLVTSCAAALLATEISLRVVAPSPQSQMERIRNVFRFDRRLGWRLVAGEEAVWTTEDGKDVPIKINSAGFRDREYDNGAEENAAQRIAVVGDSYVANVAIDQPQVFTARLHAALQPRFDVRNYGVGGYGQVQELVLLDEVLAKWHPTIALLVVYVGNDFSDNLGDFGVQGYKRPRAQLAPTGEVEAISELQDADRYQDPRAGPVYRLLSGMRMHLLFQQGFHKLVPSQEPALQKPLEVGLFRRDWGVQELQALQVMKSLLIAMSRKSTERSCKFGIVIAPTRSQVEDEEWSSVLEEWRKAWRIDVEQYDRTMPNRMLLESCRQAGYPCLDLLPALKARAQTGEHLYFRIDHHWNQLAQVRVADAILKWLQDGMQ